MTTTQGDVLVIGGGPARAAPAYWVASHRHQGTIVERRTFPREKSCGDTLTPRAVAQLDAMGLADRLESFHRCDGIRLTGLDREMVVPWPSHGSFPDHGYTVRRSELDEIVTRNAVAAGATLCEGHDAIRPLVSRGFVRGAVVQGPNGAHSEVRAKYVIVADGANSRFGRSLGTFRSREWPYGTAIR